MRRKNFTARVVTRAGVIIESTPRKTMGEAKRWIIRLIEDCPNMMEPGIFSIKIINKPAQAFGAYCYQNGKLICGRPFRA